MKKLICIGEALIDLKYQEGSFKMNAGGAPANVCCAVAKLGGRSSYLGKLSNDFFSMFLLQNMQKYHIDTANVIIDDRYKTGLAFIKDGEYSFYHDDSCDLMLEESDVKSYMFDDCGILHFCSVCLVEAPIKYAHLKALEYHKGIVSFDVNIRRNLWKNEKEMIKTITQFIPYADIIKVTEEELKEITGFDELEGVKKLKEISSKWQLVFITKGVNGVTVYDADLRKIHEDAICVEAIDTTGAGDCFIGSILYCILKDNLSLTLDNMKNPLKFAVKASSIKVSRNGAMEGMPNYFDMFMEPIFLERNRVFRIYLGGKGYHELLGDENKDNMFPEEWIASNVKAINPKYFGKRDGVSVIKGTSIYLDDLLKEDKRILGNKKYDFLVKYLDSAIRLPMQVHPTKEYSRKYFNSEYGKTEAWLVIGVRENAKIYFGFKNKITKEELSLLVDKSLEEKDIMRGILNEVEPKVGDVYLIRGGLIHAIGEGCTIIEIQEPTDFTIQPENWCGDYQISDEEKYIGLTKDIALDCFNYDMVGNIALDSARITPKIIERSNYLHEALISYDDTPLFSMSRYTLESGSIKLKYGPSIWIVLDGEGKIIGKNYERSIKKGEYFLFPYACQDMFEIIGKVKLIECRGSEKNA